jgi:hypothetical protein
MMFFFYFFTYKKIGNFFSGLCHMSYVLSYVFSPQKRTSSAKNMLFINFLLLWVIFALLDPDSQSGYGPTDVIESGSETLPLPNITCFSERAGPEPARGAPGPVVAHRGVAPAPGGERRLPRPQPSELALPAARRLQAKRRSRLPVLSRGAPDPRLPSVTERLRAQAGRDTFI